MIKKIGKLFLQGLLAILPVALTIYILYWLAVSAESILGKAIRLVLPENFYLPGMGVLASFLIILAIGILLKLWLFRKIFQWGEKIIEKVPLIKFIIELSIDQALRFMLTAGVSTENGKGNAPRKKKDVDS